MTFSLYSLYIPKSRVDEVTTTTLVLKNFLDRYFCENFQIFVQNSKNDF